MRKWIVRGVVLLTVFVFAAGCGESKTKKPANDSNQDGSDNDTPVDDESGDDSDETAVCGNDAVEAGEVCDGGLRNCTEINPALYISGKAKCKNDCTGWDTVTCEESNAVCGNEIVEIPEVCDGNIENCVNIDPSKYKGGKAKCNRNCDGFDTVTCEELDDYCGDGKISNTEFCDSDFINCKDIDAKKYSSGTAECKDDCSGYDFSSCVEIKSVCGDGKVEGKEVCEKGELKNCIEINSTLYKGGKAYCEDNCLGWDTVTCEEKGNILFSDDFENGHSKWSLTGDWDIGYPNYDISGVLLNEAVSGDIVLATTLTGGYNVKVNSIASIKNPVTIPATGNFVLTFSAYVNTDYETDFGTGGKNYYDGMIVTCTYGLEDPVELPPSTDNADLIGSFKALEGSNYKDMTGIRGTSENNTYSKFSYDLSSVSGKTVTIDFKFYSDSIQGGSGSFPGIYIDDVVIAEE